MEASDTFENLLEHIQNSNLNYKLERSPFSAIISLKKSVVRDKSGNMFSPATNTSFCDRRMQEENKNLRQQIENLETKIESLKSDFGCSVDELEGLYKVNVVLEKEMQSLKPRLTAIKKENSDIIEAAKIKTMEREVIDETNREVSNLVEQNKNYKLEIKNVNFKHEKINLEIKMIKSEKETLEKDVKNLSVTLKSSKQEVKEITKTFDIERKKFTSEISKLLDYKHNHEKEAREIKKKQKKIMKKERKSSKEVANIEVNKMKDRREAKIKERESVIEVFEEETKFGKKDYCVHSPQCVLREPSPPPLGPQTFKQSELDTEITKHEVYESSSQSVLEFLEEEPGDTLDTMITKLKALKAMFEPNNNEDSKESTFDELIKKVKTTKEAMEVLNDEEYDDEYIQAREEDQGLPRHYWSGEDGNELIFVDD